MIAVVLSVITGNPVFDALGSISIGILLVIISFVLAIKIKSLLIGQSTDEETTAQIKALLESRPEIDSIINLITFQLGLRIMVAVKTKMKNTNSVNDLIHNINSCESEPKKNLSAVHWVFFEPDIK